MDELEQQCQPAACLHSVSLAAYVKSATNLERTAEQFLHAGDLPRAYVFFKRFVNLCLITLPQHNAYSQKQFLPDRSLLKRSCTSALDQLELIRPLLVERFAAQSPPPVSDNSTALQQIPTEIAISKLSLESSQPPEHTPKISEQPAVQPRRLFPGMLPAPSVEVPLGGSGSATCACSDHHASAGYPQLLEQPVSTATATIAKSSTLIGSAAKTDQLAPNPIVTVQQSSSSDTVLAPLNLPAANASSSSFASAWKLQSLVIPGNTVRDFMAFAAANTARNQETCAVLCGKVDMHGAFRITHAILPKQVGAADRVTTSHEEELFNVQIELDVLTLGWIHTHPTQTCFLSSVDLHTQYSYQVMMPEAVAIVCAPKYNAVGYFSVTSTGMPVLQSCSQRGFHQHNQAGLYDNAAHVLLDSTGQSPCKFVDLR